ncbi:MurR/RpiR family transcriptional regulator [Thermaerobacter sp. PB12/4term]|uniref:MurR/RpiR family transcriptional regulator n=1 Tax=Thermaerobacter sp. PB12/4term TaxID=2293838 RepID=UPI001314024C|nr:MurR/RpiR family transcriptional regulator [Thermaerobacter sp. PB12/4term]QIA26707.1 MurR/RpiR family transcriptional regulator [Thermaerobacter sp. PB12/4term]
MSQDAMPGTPQGASVLGAITTARDKLTASERKVADFILSNPGEAVYLSVTELADRCGTSEASVVRFCRKAGFQGFQHLKIALAWSLVPPAAGAGEGSAAGLGELAAVSVLHDQTVQALADTRGVLPPAVLRKAAQALARARRIDVYGVGTSGMVARIAAYKLIRHGKPAFAHGDPHMQAISAAVLGPTDVALAISFSGSTQDTLHSLELAKRSGATTISITNYPRSPIRRVSDILIPIAVRENPLQSGALPVLAAQLYAVEVLVATTVEEMGDAAHQALQRTSEAVMEKKP